MNIAYILDSENKKKEFLNNALKKHNVSSHIITKINNLEIFLNYLLKSFKDNDFIILDFKLFDESVSKALVKIRQYEKLYDCKYIIFPSDKLSEEVLEEFIINNFYNISLNEKVLNDIIEGKVDENYTFTKTDEEKMEENFYVFKNDFTNIKVSCFSEYLSYLSFLVSINIANFLEKAGTNTAYLQYHNKVDYLYPFYERGIFERLEDDSYKNLKNTIEYKINDVPASFYKKDSAFLVFDCGHINANDEFIIKSDIQIVVSDSNFSNIEKLKEQVLSQKNTYVFIIDVLAEQREYIDSLNINNLYYINSINSIFSLKNSDVFHKVFKDFIEIV